MNSLKEITQVIARLKLEKIEIIDEEPKQDDQDNVSKLYFGIKSNSLTTDQQAAQYIYGSSFTDTRFTTLKNRLKNRLLNTLFFLEISPPNQSEFAEAMYKTYRYVFWAKTLLLLGARQSFEKVAKKALIWSSRSELTAETLEMLIDLRNLAGARGSRSDFNKYNEELKVQTHNLNCEILAREYYDKLAMDLGASVERPDLKDVTIKYATELESLHPQPDSLYYNQYYYRVKNFSYQINRNFTDSISLSMEAEKYLLSKPQFTSNVRLGEFVLNRLFCFLQLKQFEKGTIEAERCKELYSQNSNAWFVFMNYYFLLAMQTEHFSDAESIYNEVTANQRFQFQLDQVREVWSLYEAYLMFALNATKQSTGSDRVGKFDVKRFLRDVPNYKKDKKGYNVSILVLQIIVLLEQNDFDGIISRMDALRTYRQRYLGSSVNKQSALFFKMLMVMEKSFFTYEETKTKAQKYYDKMIELGTNSDETQEGLQILPFEWLWNRILDMLKEKEHLGIIR